jgi:hypothetical protein
MVDNPHDEVKEETEARYTVTFAITRKGPGILSDENWLDIRRTIRTRRLTFFLIAVFVVMANAALVPFLRPSRAPDMPMPQVTDKNQTPTNSSLVTPLKASDPAMLVLPPKPMPPPKTAPKPAPKAQPKVKSKPAIKHKKPVKKSP